MISGLFLTAAKTAATAELLAAAASVSSNKIAFENDSYLLSEIIDREIAGDHPAPPCVSPDGRLVVCCRGSIYNRQSLRSELGLQGDTDGQGDAELVLNLYLQHGESFVDALSGPFAIALYDARQSTLLLYRDRFGIEPLYYSVGKGYIAFSSTIKGVLRMSGEGPALQRDAVAKVLLFNYNPGTDTLLQGVKRLPAAHRLKIAIDQPLDLHRYWKLTFSPCSLSEEEVRHQLLDHLRRAVSSCLGANDRAGVFLSGGMDSSTVLALSGERGVALKTFSYRCRAASFDESHYARAMSDFVRSEHHECEYGSSEVLLMPDVVKAMNEPFCDVGINIATYLLGLNASKNGCSLVLTGDGGDELFAGHPVYEADKIAGYFDALPRPLLAPLLSVFRLLPDSDQKKSLPVKLKRFSESLAYPKDLLSHRWRIYYDAEDLGKLSSASFANGLRWQELLRDILTINGEMTDGDALSRSLYSDYQTVVDFYLRRNDLIRRFGVKVRYPLLDHKLVEFCAQMPSAMKIKGWFDTKYIFKKTMEGVLPDTIIYRKDKLGHSIPLKNWIRDDRQVKEMVLDFVSGDTISRRGLFRPAYIAELINDHLSKRRNNSHRLWTLAVLEMWLRHNLD
ncbi:MAG: asparagine synthase (glutamine-hydrolyzing) [Desulforhopalus sp.]|nr:asparagine synthase (glutamine-hydrolyzing) [Desulforhopalus sp.]